MKTTLLLAVAIVALGCAGFAYADDVAPQDFLYAFHLRWANGVPAWAGQYELTTGEQATPTPGTWAFRVVSVSGAVLEEYAMAPLQRGASDIIIPYASRGFRAEVLDAAGGLRLEVDLSGSRMCNDDGVCDTQYGEDGSNCPTDCAGVRQSAGTAAIVPQLSLSGQIGAWLMRLSMAAAAIFLFGAAVRALDSRR